MKVELTKEEILVIRKALFYSNEQESGALYDARFADILIAHPDADPADDGPEVAILGVEP